MFSQIHIVYTKTEADTHLQRKLGQNSLWMSVYHFNEDTKETMQEKIKRMPVTEASRMAVY